VSTKGDNDEVSILLMVESSGIVCFVFAESHVSVVLIFVWQDIIPKQKTKQAVKNDFVLK